VPISPEQARDELDRIAIPGALEAMMARAEAIRGAPGEVATGLIEDRYRNHRPCEAPDRRRDERIGAWLDEASDRRRRTLLTRLHPTLGDLLARTWSATIRDPYTVGWTRRAFRAPGSPELTRRSRVDHLRWLLDLTAPYEQPAAWFAAWAPHIAPYMGGVIGRMLAVAMDDGDQQVRDVLRATVRGEHPTGQVGAHLITALLASREPSDWTQVERLLLAAQRQEGLRTAILESVDLAHPEAFARVLRLLRAHELTRFASVVRAAGVWFGCSFEVRDRPTIDALLADTATFLTVEAARTAARDGADPGRVQLALWAAAFHDAPTGIREASALLESGSADIRLAAAHVLVDTQLEAGARALLPRLEDPDLRVAALAHLAVSRSRDLTGGELEPPLRRLLGRVTAPVALDLGLLRPEPVTMEPTALADTLVAAIAVRDVLRIADLVERMSPHGRRRYAQLLAEDPARHRDHLLGLLGDRSGLVVEVALHALADGPPPGPGEAPGLEVLLRRKAATLRRGVIELLLRQDDDAVLASVHRLREGQANQRTAGLELLKELCAADRGGDDGRALAHLLAHDPSIAEGDRALLAATLEDDRAQEGIATLADPDGRTPVARPVADAAADLTPWRPGIDRVLTSLDAWLTEHRDVEVTVNRGAGRQVMLVSDLRYLRTPDAASPWEEQRALQPLPELFDPWWERTSGQLTADGLEALLAWGALRVSFGRRAYDERREILGPEATKEWPRWLRELTAALTAHETADDLSFASVVAAMLPWYAAREARPDWIDPLLELAEAALAAIPDAAIAELPRVAELLATTWDRSGGDWRANPLMTPFELALELEALRPELFDTAQRTRLWQLCRFVDEPQGPYVAERDGVDPAPETQYMWPPLTGPVPRRPARRLPPLGLVVRSVTDGVASRDDLVDLLVTPPLPRDEVRDHAPLGALTRRRPHPLFAAHPWLQGAVDELRTRILELESVRGELPTPVSAAARQLRSVHGAATVVRLLATLGSQSLVRGWSWGGDDSKPAVLSHLIRVAFPAPDDQPETFAAAAREAALSEKRLLDLAVYAPQWAPSVEHTLGWAGLTDAVHWLHAHTKDDRWNVDQDVREEWAATTHERTPLPAEELVAGHVDVAWFGRVRDTLGDDRFDRLLKAARLASSSGGHKRAELFANALRGTLDRDELDRRITAKRHQDGVRALGLLPLPATDDAARAEVLARYEQLQAWRKASSRFGAQRRASEALAVEVAMANLARTAGYADPQRLQWAMEAEAICDLAAGPVTVTEDDVTITLSLSAEGAPELQVRRGERMLKSVPKAVAKREAVTAVKERVAQLRDQTRRMRASLEAAMVRGETFTAPELDELAAHPTLAPMLRSLVLVTASADLGQLTPEGHLVDLAGTEVAIPDDGVRVAHPVDLLDAGDWHDWQHHLFTSRTRQPYKQVFRELYVPTAAERNGTAQVDRYAGHQINPRQAMGLFGARGWVAEREFGAIRTYHDEGITVRAAVLDGFLTAAEAADTTLESVTFTRVGSWEPLAIEDVPPRLFSEAMRDLDLVVSVAHSGGVDPEATASTVEMRAALVRETADLLDLDNLELTDHHVLVTGTLGSYSIHLGSGTVHRRPGNAICIVPVGAQHRGRLFLPFVDDDPRTAEVVSKVVLLARDERIQDPSILAQLRA
jgi:hypothetical protein